jgi:hypothetical protein
MPIAKGQVGRPGAQGIPGDRFLRGKPFRSKPFTTLNDVITGVTKDSAGTPLGNCVVQLFRTLLDALVEEKTSDASGNFSFYNPASGPFYIVAYKAGAPDVAGTTLNTLTASQV